MANLINKCRFRLFMKANTKIFQAYLTSQENKHYFNQLRDSTKLSHSSLQNALVQLVKTKTLKLIKTKGNVFYQIQNKRLISLKFAELSQKRFNKLNIDVKVPLRNFIEQLPKQIFTVVLFGSASQKEEQEGSDIDVLLVSEKKVDINNIKKEVNLTSNYPLSIFTCTTDQFYANKDHMIIQARKTGFPIYREQNFHEVLLNEY